MSDPAAPPAAKLVRHHADPGRTVHRTDGYLPIEDYAAIGDGHALALVGRDGAIDWMCLPWLDSPSIFAAILDPDRGGRFVLQPAIPFTAQRSYIDRTNVLEIVGCSAFGSFEIEAGREALLAMVASSDQSLPIPGREAVERRLGETAEVWRSWVSRHSYSGPWLPAVERSLLAIKLLADARTGAIAAAGTTSLPEVPGGQRNYDYRFGWVRDLCFTLDAVLAVGMQELTHASVSWLLDATAHTHPRIDPVYTLGSEVVRSQEQLPLVGYRRTGPVHPGNNAGSQLQLGGFGDLVETICSYVSCGHLLAPATGDRLADSADLLARIWRNQDSGLWELSPADYGTGDEGPWR